MKARAEFGRFNSIEGARAVMALWVVLGHSFQQAGIDHRKLHGTLGVIANANLPVFVFMIMSGFVIANLITSKEEPYSTYIIRRFFRLAPLLWACLAFVVAFSFYFPKAMKWQYEYTAHYLVAYATMMHGAIPHDWLPDASRSILPPAWSISLEWQFYLIAPLLFWKRPRFALLVASVVAVTFLPRALRAMTGLDFDSAAFLPETLGYFLVGIISYLAVTRLPPLKISTLTTVAVGLTIFATTQSHPIAIWAAILCTLFSANAVGSVLTSSALMFLGRISYSIYLVHMIVITPVAKLIMQKTLQMELGSWNFFFLLLLATFPVVIAVSYLTWRFIEAPGQLFGSYVAKRFTGKMWAPHIR